MIEQHRPHLSNFEERYIREVTEQVIIEERDENGQGRAIFDLRSSSIQIFPRAQHPLLWHLAEKKCSDGAFVTFNDGEAHLHLVELKCKLTPSTWAKVVRQFHGMYLNAVASIRLLEIVNIATTTCYISATEDAMSGPVPTALIKTGVGVGASFGGKEYWEKDFVPLPFDVKATLVKGWRESAPGSTDHFGLV